MSDFTLIGAGSAEVCIAGGGPRDLTIEHAAAEEKGAVRVQRADLPAFALAVLARTGAVTREYTVRLHLGEDTSLGEINAMAEILARYGTPDVNHGDFVITATVEIESENVAVVEADLRAYLGRFKSFTATVDYDETLKTARWR